MCATPSAAKNEQAVRVHVMFTLPMFTLATAYRLQCEREVMEGESMGWQRWRHQLLEQTRGKVLVFAQGCYGIFHSAEHSLLPGVKLKTDLPTSAHSGKFLRSIDSHPGVEAYVGISG